MAVKLDQKIVIHHHPITLPVSLGITKEIMKKRKSRRIAVPIQERGSESRKAMHAAMAQLRK